MLLLLTTIALGAPGPAEQALGALEVTADERALLAETRGLYRYDRNGLGDHTREAGISMHVVNASPHEIWPHIQDCDSYVRFLPYVTGSKRSNLALTESGGTWTCAMEFTTRGIVSGYSVDLDYQSNDGRATFAMTDGTAGVLREVEGSWQTAPWPDDPDKTLLIYVFESRTAWWVPGFARRMASERGLADITRLVGRQAERANEESAP
ncbi:MAG: SRPBCC family protein [Proteobacteria bacterium]|nr:SRPBCC family protein [Pseudomonadota bacterium]